MHAHVIGSEQREAGIGTARAVGIDRVLGELAEGRGVAAKAIGVVCVAGDAGHDLGVATLDSARGPPDRDDAGSAAHRNMVEPSQGQPEVLGEADRGVRRQGEACYGKAIDTRLGNPGAGEQFGERAAEKPVRAPDRVAYVRDRHRRGENDVVIRRPRHQVDPPR